MKLLDDDEAEQTEYVVCLRKGQMESLFDDNIDGVCCMCGSDIFWGVNAPKKPKRICLQCAVENEGGMDKLLEVSGTSQASLNDVKRKLM